MGRHKLIRLKNPNDVFPLNMFVITNIEQT